MITEFQQSVFDGLVLSDAHIELVCKNARFCLSSKHKSFVDKAKEILSFLPWGEDSELDIYDKRTDKRYHKCSIRTKIDKYITFQHERWYKDGVKIIPADLVINKDVLEWWYIGDGHLKRKKSRPNYRRVELATECFSFEEISRLVVNLKNLLDVDSIYIESNEIMIAKKALVKFANLLTNCPVIDYQYKYDFGNYVNENYFSKSYENRPLNIINAYRKIHKTRELNFKEVIQEMK